MKLLAEIAPAEFDILHEGAVAELKKVVDNVYSSGLMTSLWNVGCTLSLALLNNGKESKIISALQLFTFSPSGKA
ncbi:hypothetical protein [Akkermansia muciniphila]|jgi:hypothetical protein|uniref:hypothetical protein n=1 Tax=Akkermansia muciniphila TaxID=239935 RepID=UPI0011AF43B7|nr:hypothetical protein [Akkermansia muciniphila]